jgi:hypothetical protein
MHLLKHTMAIRTNYTQQLQPKKGDIVSVIDMPKGSQFNQKLLGRTGIVIRESLNVVFPFEVELYGGIMCAFDWQELYKIVL